MSLKRPQMVLLDLDGTLVDSVPDLAASVDWMMSELGLPACGESRVRDWVGNGVERLVMRALTGELWADPPEEAFARALPLFRTAYTEHNGRHSRLFPGVAGGLEYLRGAGYRLGCVTNKAEAFTLPLLRALGIDAYFGIVVSGDTLPQKKPDPAPLLHAAERLGVAPARALMVGDSEHDVKAARAAGFQVACVSYGYNHGRDIATAQPDAVVDSLEQLRTLLEEAA
jgi:phosphoglycolate phosphatase